MKHPTLLLVFAALRVRRKFIRVLTTTVATIAAAVLFTLAYAQPENVGTVQQQIIYAQPGRPPIPPQGAGTWRAADLTVLSGSTYTIGPNKNQITAFGDSGGPRFIWDNNVPYITDIQSSSVPVCNNTSPLMCRQTVTGISSSAQTSVPAVRDWIAAVLKTQWHPSASSEPIWVQLAEIIGTKWGFNDVRCPSCGYWHITSNNGKG